MLRLPNPNQYIIYDPLTARPDPANPNRVIRDPFPNNVIPRDRIFNPDGTYKNKLFGLYAAMVPQPNQNFVENGQQPTRQLLPVAPSRASVSHLFGVRLDYNLSASDRFFFRGSGSSITRTSTTGRTSRRTCVPRTARQRSRSLQVVVHGHLDARLRQHGARHAALDQPVLPTRQVSRADEVQAQRCSACPATWMSSARRKAGA